MPSETQTGWCQRDACNAYETLHADDFEEIATEEEEAMKLPLLATTLFTQEDLLLVLVRSPLQLTSC